MAMVWFEQRHFREQKSTWETSGNRKKIGNRSLPGNRRFYWENYQV